MARIRVTCPNCGSRPIVDDRGNCTCGVYLIHNVGMPPTRLQARAYKRDADGSWRLVFDPDDPKYDRVGR